MSKITRKAQKIFGSSAGTNQIAEFGSLAAGTPVFSTDPDIIQSLSNFLTGWYGAVIGANSPAIEDMNALCFLFAYQLAYLMQAGVAEWNSGTTYYTGSLVNSGGITYVSLTDNNLNNAVTDPVNWAQPTQNGSVVPKICPASTSIASGNTMMWPYMTINSSKIVTVANNAALIGINSIIISGTGSLVVQGSGFVQIL